MTGHLSNLYGPAVEELLKRFNLNLPDDAQAMLTNQVVLARCEAGPSKEGTRSPVPDAVKALRHAKKLAEYLERPNARKEAIAKRSESLRRILLSSGLLALEIALQDRMSARAFSDFAESLDSGPPDAHVLSTIVGSLEEIAVADSGWQSVGRPISLSTTIVRTGCIAWKIAGRADLYTWNNYRSALEGDLPDFLRALLSFCNGTNALVARIEKTRLGIQSPRRRAGDTIDLSDAAIQADLLACRNDGLI